MRRHHSLRHPSVWIGGLLVALALGSCNQQPSPSAYSAKPSAPQAAPPAPPTAATSVPPAAKPHYVVTVLPLKFIFDAVCGDRADVAVLLRPGANAHTYDPTPSDAEAVQRATGFFYIGKEFDEWAAQFSTPHKVELVPLLPKDMTIDLVHHEEWGQADDDDDPHAPPIPDPHFACDPLLVKGLLPALVAKLSELDPGGAAAYQANAAAFGQQLEALNGEIATELAPVKGAPVFEFHPSFNYFIKRYALKFAGVVEPFPGKEPSPKYLQGIAREVEQAHAKAIFNETLLPAAPADVIAEAAHVKAYQLDPSCGNSGKQYTDYADWLRYNAGVFLEALK